MLKSAPFLALALAFVANVADGRPQGPGLVTTIPPRPTNEERGVVKDEDKDLDAKEPKPIITELDIRSDIQYRYAKTVVKSYIKNPSVKQAQNVTFNMVLPDTAFISNFTIQVVGDEKIYVAKVAKKEEAKKTFEEALQSGQSAGLVDADTRDANQITVNVNLESSGKMEFVLTYEEHLTRHNSRYEHVIHVNPGQLVKDFRVNVHINESLPVSQVNVPELKTDPNAITSQLDDNEIAVIERNVDGNPNRVHISFNPSVDVQAQLSEKDDKNKEGVSGQFIVQYDVDRKGQGNEIQILDGYFVHFFAPEELQPLPRHVIFVLDVSGSMSGTKLQQTKDAMVTIIDDMTDQDYFNILTFSDHVYHWISEDEKAKEGEHKLTYQGTEAIRKEALTYVLGLETIGGTNIHDGLFEALKVVTNVKVSETLPSSVKPIIIFLTDGQATTGITSSQAILDATKAFNEDTVPIYGLAFGQGADFRLIKDVSLQTDAFARRIYEASDAAIQLEDFYAEISSPLLNNLNFSYVGESFKNKTNSKFNTFFKGGEYVVAGKIDQDLAKDEDLEIVITGDGKEAEYTRRIPICWLRSGIPEAPDAPEAPVALPTKIRPLPPIWPCFPLPEPKPQDPKSEAENFIERLWAFMTIKNLLDERFAEKKDKLEELDGSAESAESTESSESSEESTESSESSEGVAIDDMVIEPEPSPPKPKTRREKALDIALKYNFVTELTSLVVVKPDQEEPEEVAPKPVALNEGSLFGGHQISAQFSPGLQFFSVNRRVVGGVGLNRRPALAPIAIAAPAAPGTFPTTTFVPATTSTTPDYYDFVADEYEDLYGHPQGQGGDHEAEETTEDLSTSVCVILLYSKTYLRGEELILDKAFGEEYPDFKEKDFDNKLTSLSVEGPCCWMIYSEPNFEGESKKFADGEFNSAGEMGPLFREASSAKMVPC